MSDRVGTAMDATAVFVLVLFAVALIAEAWLRARRGSRR